MKPKLKDFFKKQGISKFNGRRIEECVIPHFSKIREKPILPDQTNRMRQFFLFSILFILCGNLSAGNDPQFPGARRAGLAGAFTAVNGDLWALGANPAGITGLTRPVAGMYMERRFLLKEINSGAFAFAMPFNEKHFVALDFSGFGFATYNDSRLALSYATNLLGKLSLGAKFNVVHTTIKEYSSATSFVLDAGLQAQVTQTFTMGFSIFNASQSYLSKAIREKIPTVLNLGVCWKPSKKVMATADISKAENYPLSFRFGVEYQPVDMLAIRAGVATNPLILSFGLGVKWKNAILNVANTWHERLGYTPHLGIDFAFGKEKKKATIPPPKKK